MHSTKLKQKQSLKFLNTFKFEAIGTQWIIDFNKEVSPTSPRLRGTGRMHSKNKLLRIIKKRIEEFEKTYSRFREDSIIYNISQQSGTYTFPEDFSELISLYKKMYDLTDGLMTPLIGNVLEQAGYDKDYSFEKKTITTAEKWEDVLEINGTTLINRKPVTLDFGAIGKGYLIDIVGKILEENSIASYCIDAGGDILVKNGEVNIGLEHPENIKQVIGILKLDNGSICGSAGNRRKWGNMHHIINPKTLESVSGIKAVWVKAKNAALADALTTALFFVEPEKLTEQFEFDYLIIYSDYSYKNSKLFPSELYVS